ADDEFTVEHHRQQQHYYAAFEGWLSDVHQAIATTEAPVSSYGARVERLSSEHAAIRALAFTLARHCLRFLIGEAFAWMWCCRRQGLSCEATTAAVVIRIETIAQDTHDRKW